MAYDKSDFADSLGISGKDLEIRARDAGFDTTEGYYNSQQSGGGGGGGGNFIDPSNIPSTFDFATNMETGISDALNNYILTLKGQDNPLDVYTGIEDAMGIPEQRGTAQTLRDQIYDIEDTIKRVEPTIAATTRESLVTEGQRQQMSVAQKKPLLERLGEISTNLGRVDESIAAATKDLSMKVSLFMQGQQMELEPLRMQYQNIVEQAARLTTAFGVDMQNQLNVYLTNVQRGWDLDDAEREHAWELIQNENTYMQSLTESAAAAGIRLTGNESTDDILNLIGDSAAEELNYERYVKPFQTKPGDPAPTWPTLPGSAGWKIVTDPGGQPTAMQSPQMSAQMGTIQTTRSANGQTVYWVMGQNGWE